LALATFFIENLLSIIDPRKPVFMSARFLKTSIALIVLTFLQVSCASYVPQVTKLDADWSNQGIPEGKILAYRTYLIGDAGNAAEGQTLPVISYLQQKLLSAPKNSTVIFLGDNIYHAGMPSKKSEERELAEHKFYYKPMQ
jgi:hypothetical protein